MTYLWCSYMIENLKEQISAIAKVKNCGLFDAILFMVDEGIVDDVESVIENIDESFKALLKDEIKQTNSLRPSVAKEEADEFDITKLFT